MPRHLSLTTQVGAAAADPWDMLDWSGTAGRRDGAILDRSREAQNRIRVEASQWR
jgi:hypothetical protein